MLRDYQSDLINKLFRAYDDGYLAPCIVLLCGGGKSVITAEIAKHFTDGEKPVLFLVHRRELVEQIYYTFVGWGVDMSLCKIRMVQTAARRLPSMERPELIITDENHHSLAKTYQKIYDYFMNREDVEYTVKMVGAEKISQENYNLSVSTYVEKEDTREKVDIVKLNAEIKEIVAREQVLREEIDKIIAEIEGEQA